MFEIKAEDYLHKEHIGSARTPTHVAYHVRDAKLGQGFWTRVGSAWAHKDGKGFNLQLDIVPLDGRITLRVAKEKREH
jgi:hypothetical protein